MADLKGMRINRKFTQEKRTEIQGNITRVFSLLLVNLQILINLEEREVSHEPSRSFNSSIDSTPVGRD